MAPNIVLIVTDNQSPWTLGCHGNDEILTPNIDRLAREGTRFTNAFCSNPVCSPNRATYFTGLIPSQHGVHNWLGREKPDAQVGPHAYCTIGEFSTLSQILADEGYRCGLSGKWHLGDSLRPQLGFSYWFTMPRGHTSVYYEAEAIWEGKTYKEPRYFLEAITSHALDFLGRTEDRPFFLCVPFNAPYGLGNDMRKGHRNRHSAYYADKKLACFPREQVHPWLRQNLDIINSDVAIRSYAAAVSGVDDGVGEILAALAELKLDANTLVIYTADHGLCGGHHGVWGMGDHSRPLHMFQENLRIPLILRHPERIPPGRVVDTMTCNYDFFPSMLSYLGLERRKPETPALPGRSYAAALAGEKLDWDEEITFHEYENTRAVQTRQWKLVRRHPDGPDELYDMTADPDELTNLIDRPSSAEVCQGLDAQLQAFFERHADPQYDMWRGGRTKAGLILAERV
jgi:arylsulfatase A-like enzyme